MPSDCKIQSREGCFVNIGWAGREGGFLTICRACGCYCFDRLLFLQEFHVVLAIGYDTPSPPLFVLFRNVKMIDNWRECLPYQILFWLFVTCRGCLKEFPLFIGHFAPVKSWQLTCYKLLNITLFWCPQLLFLLSYIMNV